MLESLFKKKRLQHRCFSVNIEKFLRASILKNICERELLLWVAIIYLRKQDFIFLLLFVRFAWLLSMEKKTVLLLPCRKQLCFHDRITKFINRFSHVTLNRGMPLIIKIKLVNKCFDFESYWFYIEIKKVFFSVQFTSI